jgi:ABC-type proline/glycine betaine transport system ATPase subunit
LRTIIDSDRVLILDAGQVVEFDTPSTLLADPSSRFSQLIAIEQRDSQNISSPSSSTSPSSSEPSVVASSSSSSSTTTAAKRMKSQLNLRPSVQPILQ